MLNTFCNNFQVFKFIYFYDLVKLVCRHCILKKIQIFYMLKQKNTIVLWANEQVYSSYSKKINSVCQKP